MSARKAYCETPDGAKIYFEDQGQGQPLVLIHGWLCSSKFWVKNVEKLAKDFRVISVDLRGHGNSSKILSGHTISQYAQDVRTVIMHLDSSATIHKCYQRLAYPPLFMQPIPMCIKRESRWGNT